MTPKTSKNIPLVSKVNYKNGIYYEYPLVSHRPPQFNTKNPSVQNVPQLNTLLSLTHLRTEGCVELRGFWCWAEGFSVLNWGMWWIEGFLVINWGILGSGIFVLSWGGVWKWGILIYYRLYYYLQYLMFSMVLVSLSVICSVAIANVHHRIPEIHQMPIWLQRIFLEKLPIPIL